MQNQLGSLYPPIITRSTQYYLNRDCKQILSLYPVLVSNKSQQEKSSLCHQMKKLFHVWRILNSQEWYQWEMTGFSTTYTNFSESCQISFWNTVQYFKFPECTLVCNTEQVHCLQMSTIIQNKGIFIFVEENIPRSTSFVLFPYRMPYSFLKKTMKFSFEKPVTKKNISNFHSLKFFHCVLIICLELYMSI